VTAILLDTNALLWLVSAQQRVAPNVRSILADQANELYVSAVSAWEVAIKTRIGRLGPSQPHDRDERTPVIDTRAAAC
jgi:PIN domain nuclease of toxin-antitoxin system